MRKHWLVRALVTIIHSSEMCEGERRLQGGGLAGFKPAALRWRDGAAEDRVWYE